MSAVPVRRSWTSRGAGVNVLAVLGDIHDERPEVVFVHGLRATASISAVWAGSGAAIGVSEGPALWLLEHAARTDKPIVAMSRLLVRVWPTELPFGREIPRSQTVILAERSLAWRRQGHRAAQRGAQGKTEFMNLPSLCEIPEISPDMSRLSLTNWAKSPGPCQFVRGREGRRWVVGG